MQSSDSSGCLSGYLPATGWQPATGSSYGNLLTDKVIYTHSPCGRFHPLRSHGDKLYIACHPSMGKVVIVEGKRGDGIIVKREE